VIVCFKVLGDLERRNPPDAPVDVPASSHSPFSTGKAATLG
jgi:hypothetical protein